MFCNKPKSVNRSVPGKKNRKRKKKPTHPQVDNKLRKTNQSDLNVAHAMSSWAQNYTVATTWQLKHQIAYWKSRAIALQYENKVLHEIVKEQHFKQPVKTTCNVVASDSSESEEELDNEYGGDEGNEYENYSENVNDDDEENDDFVVSEEFIEFLKQNAKYKEDAKRERERLKAKHEADHLEALVQQEKLQSSEEKQARLIELYGDNWEKIVALETSLLCTFISECDKGQPEYWPNIPFNFTTC